MDINAAVNAQREAAEKEAKRRRAVQANTPSSPSPRELREAERQARREAKLAQLGAKFVTWAQRSGIRPTVVAEELKHGFFNFQTRYVKIRGWSLHTVEEEYRADPDIWYAAHFKGALAVLPDGTVKWVGRFRLGPPQRISVEYVEQHIVAYIVRSGSTVPWPK
jgi:hypothetical protein